MTNILHIDASSRGEISNSRKLSAAIVAKIGGDVTYRDMVAQEFAPINDAQVTAYYTMPNDRTNEQKQILLQSDELIAEVKAADVIVVGVPMYNFSVPAAYKLYIDLICRVGETFIYSETGPKGLLEGKKIYFAVTSGGTPIGADADHLVPLLKTVYGFIGITDQTFITAGGGMNIDPEEIMNKAMAEIDALNV